MFPDDAGACGRADSSSSSVSGVVSRSTCGSEGPALAYGDPHAVRPAEHGPPGTCLPERAAIRHHAGIPPPPYLSCFSMPTNVGEGILVTFRVGQNLSLLDGSTNRVQHPSSH